MALPFTIEHPLRRSLKYGVVINRFLDGSQQNFKVAEALNALTIDLTHLSQANRNTALTAFAAAQGQFSSSLSLPVPYSAALGGTITYTNLAFTSDQASSEESTPHDYQMSFQLQQTLAQTRTLNPTPPGSWSGYPTFASVVNVTQLPYKPSLRFLNSVSKLEAGPQYAYPFMATGLPIFYLSYPSMTDADLLTLEQYFNYQDGPVANFTFTDPDTTNTTPVTYSVCHFMNDSLDITYNEPNSSSVAVIIEVISA